VRRTGTDQGDDGKHEQVGCDYRVRDLNCSWGSHDRYAEDDADVVDARAEQVAHRDVAIPPDGRSERGHQLGRTRTKRDHGESDGRLTHLERPGDLDRAIDEKFSAQKQQPEPSDHHQCAEQEFSSASSDGSFGMGRVVRLDRR
jgi:hypothetical protein